MPSQISKIIVRPTAAEPIIFNHPLVSKDGRYVLCCCGSDIKVFSVKTGELVHILKGHKDLVTDIVFNPNNQYQFISSSLDGSLKKWNYEDGVLISSVTPTHNKTKKNVVVHIMLALPDDKKSFLYLVHLDGNTNQYHMVKEEIMSENWTRATIFSQTFSEKPTHISVGCQGELLVVVSKPSSFTAYNLKEDFKSYTHRASNRDHSQLFVQQCLGKITCVACHPLETCVAVGHDDGKINIWTNVLSKKALFSWIHWHALPVLSLKYSAEGSSLLSGGHESVLVKWQHGFYGDAEHRDYLPRLGAPINHITMSDDNSVYVTSHLDNSVKVIKNWLVSQVFQGLTRNFLDQSKDPFPAGVKFEPRSKALVLNGLPGHLQFYSVESDKLLFNLDIVGQNYVSGESMSKQMSYTAIEIVEFSSDGTWMVTVQRWSGSYTDQCRLKFWFYDEESNTYVLNTDVDSPHAGKISQISVAPPHEFGQSAMVVTIGEDKKFKIWELTDKSSMFGSSHSGVCWSMSAAGYFKNKDCSTAAFSDDGSLLAVGFSEHLTLWDPYECRLITSLDMKNTIRKLDFCTGHNANYLVIVSKQDIIIYDLLTYTEKYNWTIPGITSLSVDHHCPVMVAFADTAGFVINYNTGETTQFDLPSYARHVTSSAFYLTKPSDGGKLTDVMAVRNRLVFLSRNGSISTLEDEVCLEQQTFTPSVQQASERQLANNYKNVSPLVTLISSQLVKQKQTETEGQRPGLLLNEFIKQIGETSCIAMPSLNLLCNAFIKSCLLNRPNTELKLKHDSDGSGSESEMEVDGSDEEEMKKDTVISENLSSVDLKQELKLKKSCILNYKQAFNR